MQADVSKKTINRPGSGSGAERRTRPRIPGKNFREIALIYEPWRGQAETASAALIDIHELGCGIEVTVRLESGSQVAITGDLHGVGRETSIQGRVAWCRMKNLKAYRAGIMFLSPLPEAPLPGEDDGEIYEVEPLQGEDYYEVLQLSPNADLDMIHWAYQMLSQRYHPEKGENKDEISYLKVGEAYRVLGDPERRTDYDGHPLPARPAPKSLAAQEERKRRHALLALLYSARRGSTHASVLTLAELQDSAQLPADDAAFAAWYLCEQGYAAADETGRYGLTGKGADEIEILDLIPKKPKRPLKNPAALIPAAQK